MAAKFSPAVFLSSILSSPHLGWARVGSLANVEAAAAAKAGSNLTAAAPFTREMVYTQNSLCRQNNCVNPIFPGINDLPRLEALQWQCATTSMARQHMEFCKDAVMYDPALPSPVSKATAVNDLVKAQEDAAMTMFVYHLNGMGYDAWDHQTPSESDNDCVRSVWKMVCFTYFPRAEAGCKQGELSRFKRPCKNSCSNYIQHCGVECCDESVQCAFTHTSYSSNGTLQVLQTGYVDANGPSAMCTGGARRSLSFPLMILLGIFGFQLAIAQKDERETNVHQRSRGIHRCFLFGIIGVLAFFLQGCEAESIPQHAVGNWRAIPSYLNQFKYVPEGKNVNNAVLNSCAQKDLPAAFQCNGKGYCREFSPSGITAKNPNPVAFCQCDRDWADPECGSRRKSQTTAFFWSLFLGFLGADYFYLGFPLWGVAKLVTLGGLGFWWLTDIVRTAAGPVYAFNYRTANDLHHWAAVLIIISVALFVGFFVALKFYFDHRQGKRQDMSELQYSEEASAWKRNQENLSFDGPRFRVKERSDFAGPPGFSGYGATLPRPLPNAGVPNTPAGMLGPPSAPGHHGIPYTSPVGMMAVPSMF